jgi:hypothetical protein
MSEHDELPTIEQTPPFKAIMGICFGIGAGVMGAREFERWHSVGQIQVCGRFEGPDGKLCHLITHAGHPLMFDWWVLVYSMSLLFGLAGICMLYQMLTDRKKLYRMLK